MPMIAGYESLCNFGYAMQHPGISGGTLKSNQLPYLQAQPQHLLSAPLHSGKSSSNCFSVAPTASPLFISSSYDVHSSSIKEAAAMNSAPHCLAGVKLASASTNSRRHLQLKETAFVLPNSDSIEYTPVVTQQQPIEVSANSVSHSMSTFLSNGEKPS